MPLRFKRYFLLLLLGAALTSLWLGHARLALVDLAVTFAWLAYEDRLRRRFTFVALGRLPERVLAFETELHAALALPRSPLALFVEHGPRLHAVDLAQGRRLWSRSFDEARPLAVLLLPDASLIWAGEQELHWTDAQGRDLGSSGFEAPLFRQSYHLMLSADGATAALHTPWFIQLFDPKSRAMGARIRYEEAGHYFKYAAIGPDGRSLLLAGALLLEGEGEEAGGAGIEARWDYWQPGPDGRWAKAWGKAYESYNNTHLRGVAISDDAEHLLAEVYQSGYEFKLYKPDGSAQWERPGGERPVMSPHCLSLAFETAYDGLVVSRAADKQKLWSHKPVDKIRFKRVDDAGRCIFLEGRHLRLFGPDGVQIWDAWLAEDPEELSLGVGGRLAVFSGRHAGILQLPWDI